MTRIRNRESALDRAIAMRDEMTTTTNRRRPSARMWLLACTAGLACSATLTGCPDPDPISADAARADAPALDAFIERPDAFIDRTDAGRDAYAPPGVDAPQPDAWVHVCPPVESRPVTTVRGEIRTDTTWDCDHTWLIESDGDQGPLYVTNGATLTVEAGTVVRGAVRDGQRHCTMATSTVCTADSNCTTAGDRCGAPSQQGTALVVARGAHLIAEGTSERPIVFTSNNFGNMTTPARGGDWGGIVMLGDAPTNWDPADGAQIEGLPSGEGRGVYGGSNTAGSCGSLRYVRVEYAGYIVGRNNELNGITLGGCGGGTLLDHVQVHLGLDDGIELFGGSANVRYAIVTGTGDDSLDYDLGWTGNVQFFIAQQRDVAGEDRCIEADDHPNNYTRTPYSRPTIYNFSCIGSGTPGTDQMDGVILRRGGQGILRNSIFFNSPDRGLQVQDLADSMGVTAGADTISWFRAASGPGSIFENNILFRIGPDPDRNRYFTLSAGSGAATGVEDVLTLLQSANDEGTDPMFAALATDFTSPDFAPASASPAASGAAATPSTPSGFWQPASYRGAVRPGASGAELWYVGWTRFTN